MYRKLKQKLSSLIYSLQKATWKTATYRPSPYLIALIVMGISIFLLGGGVYDVIKASEIPSVIPLSGNRFIFFYPYYLHEQILTESIVVMILYALGASGLWLIYRSTKYIRSPRQVSFLVRIGVALIILAFVVIEVILYWKLNFS